MVIWKGWGILAVVYIALCAGLLGGAAGGALVGEQAVPVTVGMGFVLGGALTTLHGWHLNIARPRAKAADWEAVERPRLVAAAARGALVVDNVQPRDRAEADAMIEDVVARGRTVIGRHGPHSMFWIPMEVIGLLAVAGGLLLAVHGGVMLVTA